jgi:hypothetical protein
VNALQGWVIEIIHDPTMMASPLFEYVYGKKAYETCELHALEASMDSNS